MTDNEVRDKDVAEWIENDMNRIEESTKTRLAKKMKNKGEQRHLYTTEICSRC